MAETKKSSKVAKPLSLEKRVKLRDFYTKEAEDFECGYNGKESSNKKAIASYKKAIEYGSVLACVKLGEIYSKGVGHYNDRIKKDDEKAKQYFNLAYDTRINNFVSKLGNCLFEEKCTYELAFRFMRGDCVDKDPVKAQKLIECAANGGDFRANLYLAKQYYYGRGKPKDIKKAAAIYYKIAYPCKLHCTYINVGEDQWLYALCIYHGYVKEMMGWMYWIRESAKNGYKPAIDYLNKIAAKQKQKAAASKKVSNGKPISSYSSSSSANNAAEEAQRKAIEAAEKEAQRKAKEAEEALENERRNIYHHVRTDISVQYYNERTDNIFGLTVYDADATVTFTYQNYYGATKTRVGYTRFLGVGYNSVTVSDCEYRCSAYLGDY